MIAACPTCGARYRVDPDRIGPEGARLKCAKCSAVFRVHPPAERPAAAEVARPAPAPVTEPRASESDAALAPSSGPPELASDPGGQLDSSKLVLIADPEVDSSKATAEAVKSWGLQPVIVHDGVEAMLTVQRMLPAAVVLDAALPKMFGFQVCEVIKRNESLRETVVALVGAIHDKDRYRRPPVELYGADCYLERPDLPDGLRPILEQAGMSMVGGPDEPVQAGAPPMPAGEDPLLAAAPPEAAGPVGVPDVAPDVVQAEPTASPPVQADDGLGDERAKAERLARIIISDILLYNAEKFEAALAGGNVVEALDAELGEGRALFVQRVDARVRDDRDFLTEELERVAREKGQ